ncbi:MAG: phosphatidate cytidylyltransferase [Candidatus Enteromonas sp.]
MGENTPKRKKGARIEVNQLDEKKKKNMLNRVLFGILIVVICVPSAALGSWVWFALMTLLLVCAVYEIMKAPQKKYRWYVWVATYLIVFSYVYWFLLKFNVQDFLQYQKDVQIDPTASFAFSLETHFHHLSISIYGMAFALAIYCLWAILHEDFTWNDVMYFFLMTFLLGVGFQAMLFLRYYPFAIPLEGVDATSSLFRFGESSTFLFYVVITTCLNDVFAYFVGVLFGKHHINPRISPNKTWEGFIGGIVLGGLVGFGFALLMEGVGAPILPGFSVFKNPVALAFLLPLSFTIPLIANLGDFTFSTVKRHFGFKDYGRVLGAHGGILDRLDSLIFTSTYASIFAVFSATNWNFFA